jgi:Ca2+-binding RTX toxin-like protein
VGVKFVGISDYPPYAGSWIENNLLSGAAQPFGTTTINTGAGDDYVGVGNGDPFIDSGKAANYVIDLGSGNNIFDGGSTRGPSTIRVTAGNGNDILDVGGFGGDYTINAGGGNNRIYLASGNASVWAGSGNDVVTTNFVNPPDGSPGFGGGIAVVGLYVSPTSDGGLGGQRYKQSIDAGNGNNQIALPVFGQTDIKTGSGQDFILARSAARLFLEGAPLNSDVVNISSGGGDDTVITFSTKSLIKTGSGNDTVFAGLGDDTIYTGSGNNLINLRGGTVTAPHPLVDVSFVQIFDDLNPDTGTFTILGGGNDTVYLRQGDDCDRSKKGYGKATQGRDTIVLGGTGFATVYGFGRNDALDVTGLNASFTRSGHDTLINAGGRSIGVLKGYTGSIGLA